MVSGGTTSPTVRALMTGLIDYAGLFPPAELDMADAMTNYAEYVRGEHAWMLGRFVVPVGRLSEFDERSAQLLERGDGSAPWRLAALAGSEIEADIQEALKFNCRHWQGSEIGHALIDALELKAAADFGSKATKAKVPDFFTLYVESSSAPADAKLLDAVKAAGARAKIRMGGVTADAFPAAEDVIAFMSACADRGLSFKATAGLHHLIRAEHPLTYRPGSERGPMYGFLNVFLAAAAILRGATMDEARGILLESRLSAFAFTEDAITWGSVLLGTDDIKRGRELATSYGSCSFREPVYELLAAGLID